MTEESFLICQKVADDLNVEYDLIKSINDVIFKEVSKAVREPDSLIVGLQPLGNFYYRDKKTLEKLRNNLYFNHPDKEQYTKHLSHIMDMYEVYKKDKLEFKYEKFGKESHEAYLLAKKQKKLSGTKEVKPE